MLFREYISLLLTWFSFKLWEKWEGLQCHGCLVHFVNNAIYTSLFAIILNLQMEKLQLHIKHICLLRNIAKSPNNKIKFEKKMLCKHVFKIRSCNPLQSSSSLSIRSSGFPFSVLFIPSFNVLGDYFIYYLSVWWQFSLLEFW